MARTSRKKTIKDNEVREITKYRTGIYVRLSVKELEGKTETIENQEFLIHNFLKDKPEFEVIDVYRDHGKTGVNFHRNEFQRLKRDIEQGEINAVIVKDLSRFARNHVGAGEFLETVFSNLHVRFIAINDNYDSISATATEIQTLHLTNLANEMFAHDISKKIAPVLKSKQERGEFIGAWASFGYMRDPKNKNKIIVDEEAVLIVEKIYKLKAEGMGSANMVRFLSEENIPCPSKYRFDKGIVSHERFKNAQWKITTLKKILTNEVYLGHTVQGQKKQSLANNQKQILVPREEWIIVKNTHPAIISQELYDKVQSIMGDRNADYKSRRGMNDFLPVQENLFKGIIYCGECGKTLTRHRKVRRNKNPKKPFHEFYYYYCPIHAENLHSCSFTSISEEKVKNVVFETLKKQKELAKKYEDVLKHPIFRKRNTDSIKLQQTKINDMIMEKQKLEKLKGSLYASFLDEVISESDFLFMTEEYTKDLAIISGKLEENLDLLHIAKIENPQDNIWLKEMVCFTDVQSMTATMAQTLVHKIIVHDNTHIQIELAFADELERLTEQLSEVF